MTMKTYIAKTSELKREWFLIDAEGQILGRLATKIADILRGKNKPIFTPNVDTGDFVVVINAEKVKVTGKKAENKQYRHYTGYPGGIVVKKYPEVLKKHPERIIQAAVRGMIPKNKIGRAMLKKLKIYAGPNHPHQAQQPKPLKL